MQDNLYAQIITVLGMSIWFIFPIGMFLSVMKQDRDALPPHPNIIADHNKIFEHKKMLYENEEDDFDLNIYSPNEQESIDFFIDENNHPHEGVGSTQQHHIHYKFRS
jgi:hypothetical protein